MKNNNIKYIVFLVIFTLILDLVFGKIYEKLYFSKASVKNDPLIYAVTATNEDILIFGSSRAKHHYNPKIISDSLGMSCYNVGSGGQNIYYHLAMLEATLERYTPKIVILELFYIDFEKTPPQWETDKLGILLPFANKSEAAFNAVLLRGQTEKFKLLSSVYTFNSLQYSMLRNNFLPFNNHINGFIPIPRIWDKPLSQNEYDSNASDSLKMNALYQFIDLCNHKNVQLFITVSPIYEKVVKESRYAVISNDLRQKYGIQVVSFENDSIFIQHPEYFADPLHLNKKGAEKYTQSIIKAIKSK
jgi:hypothetical protein